ncbi:hypothetical protein [Polyangium sorediatum]|uniref:Uncharacterized protein n=1 Tax=Polyangium sorediatum TaxID=889274 RepID=A0ABT6NMC8_9BACT|nr:hypothetical protein [Polyangium sorediatum]MDI1429474.1 hypothetical protein [Polyangium sorediatum]
MVLRNHPRGRLAFDRDSIVRAALRAYVEARVERLGSGLWFPVCDYSTWTGDVHRGALRTDSGCGDEDIVAWTEAGVVGLAYELGWGPVERFKLPRDAITHGPEDVRGAVPGLPAELEPALVIATSMLSDGNHLEKLASIGFWLYGDRVGGTLFDDPKGPGAERLVPWGMLQNGRLPFCLLGELAAKAAERARTTDAPIHAIIDAVVDRRLQGPTEFTTDELATLLAKPPDPKQLLAIQRRLQEVGITWPGSPELPPEELPPGPRLNPFTKTPMPEPKRSDK